MRADDKRHGTNAGYVAGCRCDDCRTATRNYHKRLVMDRPRRVSSLGVRRRIQALACLGWDMYAIARHVGTGRETVRQWTIHETVYRSTHERMAKAYDELSMRLPPQDTHHERANVARTRNRAARNGWAPPLAWDDIDAPNERPNYGTAKDKRRTWVDHARVERRISGDRSVWLNRLEAEEVVRRLYRAGRTTTWIEDNIGLKPSDFGSVEDLLSERGAA